MLIYFKEGEVRLYDLPEDIEDAYEVVVIPEGGDVCGFEYFGEALDGDAPEELVRKIRRELVL